MKRMRHEPLAELRRNGEPFAMGMERDMSELER